jgi:hypothetical protein
VLPKGCVFLTAAVDRLAEARRTAGQTNDAGRNAAREALRGEFYSGSMLAMVIYPGTGATHTIYPERWGLEEALTWLEQGECLLTGGLVYPRLDLSFTKEPTVSIFVNEHDLQRLMAKQEVKQEAAPRLDVKELWPKSPPLSGEPRERVEEQGQTKPAERELLEPKVWLAGARKDNPRRRNESPGAYATRLHALMQEAAVTKVWSYETLLRRLYDK